MQIHPLAININAPSFEIQNALKMCAGASPVVLLFCACFVGLLTMLLHHTPLAEKFMNSCS
jgi:hypothetical protein